MEKRYVYMPFLLLLVSITGCETEKVIDIDFPRPLVVINAILHPDSVMGVEVSASFNSMFREEEEIGNVTPQNTYDRFMIDDAEVKLWIDGVFKGIMNKGNRKGYYYMPGCYPAAGEKISLEVNAGKYPQVTAQSYMPEPVAILSVDTVRLPYTIGYGEKKSFKTHIKFKDEARVRNYYCLRLQWRGRWTDNQNEEEGQRYSYFHFNTNTDEEIVLKDAYYPYSNIFVTSPYAAYGSSWTTYVFDDYLFDGEEYTLKIIMSLLQSLTGYDTLELLIELFTISEESYLYCRSKILQEKQQDVLGDSGLREPIPTYTNVKGGYGLVSAQQKACRYIITYPKELADN